MTDNEELREILRNFGADSANTTEHLEFNLLLEEAIGKLLTWADKRVEEILCDNDLSNDSVAITRIREKIAERAERGK